MEEGSRFQWLRMLSGRVLLVSSLTPGQKPIQDRPHMGLTPGWIGGHTDDQARRYLKPGLPESHHGSDVEFDLLKTGQN